ncbi:hypothetical protein FACS189498_2770 [Spirochaetia bacterium]|nr:hypothetical protein FACS189498_2770 [Spirochaetia bacterium]
MIGGVISTLAQMFSYTFIVNAFIVGILVSICSALLGVSLVLKRYSMIGDGLSHVGFGSLALATALNLAPLAVSIPLVVAAAFLLLHLSENNMIKGDAAIAMLSTSSLALGVIIISQTTGLNTDVCNYLFGSILAMKKTDVYLSVALSITVLVLFILFYHKLFAVTFDESFARASGVKTRVYNMLIAFFTAITIVLGMRMLGAMLISALIIFPALTSMRIFKTFRGVCISSVCVSIVCFFSGIVISFVYAMPTGASVVMVNILAFLLFSLLNILSKRKRPIAGAAFIGMVCLFIIAGCKNSGEIIEIKEKMFIAQTNEIYLNAEDYLGKTIKYEGLFKKTEGDGHEYCFVLRYGPGCCGYDGSAGFEVAWDKNKAGKFPQSDDWVEAAGTLKSYDQDGFPFLYIALSSLKVLETRGAEYVTQ